MSHKCVVFKRLPLVRSLEKKMALPNPKLSLKRVNLVRPSLSLVAEAHAAQPSPAYELAILRKGFATHASTSSSLLHLPLNNRHHVFRVRGRRLHCGWQTCLRHRTSNLFATSNFEVVCDIELRSCLRHRTSKHCSFTRSTLDVPSGTSSSGGRSGISISCSVGVQLCHTHCCYTIMFQRRGGCLRDSCRQLRTV
jgi:hypothetical protein